MFLEVSTFPDPTSWFCWDCCGELTQGPSAAGTKRVLDAVAGHGSARRVALH